MAALTDSSTTLAELKTRVLAFVQARDWEQFHSPKNLSMALAAEAGELMEHFLWATPEQSAAIARDPAKRQKIADEIADVVIYSLEFANATGLDLSAAIEAKMAANAKKYPVEKSKGRSEKSSIANRQFASRFSAKTQVVVEIEQVGKSADVVAGGFIALEHAGDPFVTLGAAGAELLEPGGPGDDFVQRALRLGVDPREHLDIGPALLDLGEHGLGFDPRERKEALVERAVVFVVAAFAGEDGAGLVEEAGQVGVTAEANAEAAGRMLGEIGCRIINHNF